MTNSFVSRTAREELANGIRLLVLENHANPTVSISGYLMGGAVIIEIIFNIQAMGQLILDGVTRNDVYLVQGVTLTVAIAFIVVNILVDLLYVLVNPRIRSI